MSGYPRYVVDPSDVLPERWRYHIGALRVLTKRPIEGYVMVRRPGAIPFCLRLAELLNVERHGVQGPFECVSVDARVRRIAD